MVKQSQTLGTAPDPATRFVDLLKRFAATVQARIADKPRERDARLARFGAQVEQQMLYEKWLKHDAWKLRREALALLIGVAPEELAEIIGEGSLGDAEHELWEAVQSCISSGSGPKLRDAAAAPGAWAVTPGDLYAWAKGLGCPLPEAFDSLMGFILSTVKRPAAVQPEAAAVAPPAAAHHEAVLGAALALVANYPEQCVGEHGWVEAASIARLIEAKSALWFDGGLPISVKEMTMLIDKWLKTL